MKIKVLGSFGNKYAGLHDTEGRSMKECNPCTGPEGSRNLRLFDFKKRWQLVSGRQPQTYVKPEAAITVFELLMMSGVSLETC
jgi:hypothetical protein